MHEKDNVTEWRHGVTSRSDDFLINVNKITDTYWYKYNACAY